MVAPGSVWSEMNAGDSRVHVGSTHGYTRNTGGTTVALRRSTPATRGLGVITQQVESSPRRSVFYPSRQTLVKIRAYEKSTLKPKTNNRHDVRLASGNHRIFSRTLA
ncbi:hypothetical protein MRX96_041269 [Rhipicephalus microplus]